jgi:hypothetical protein
MAIKINQQSWSPFLITRLCHQNLRNNSVESPNSVSHVYHPPCWVISAPHNRNSFMFHTGINLSPNPKIGIFLPECSHTCPSKSCNIHSSLVCWESTLSRICPTNWYGPSQDDSKPFFLSFRIFTRVSWGSRLANSCFFFLTACGFFCLFWASNHFFLSELKHAYVTWPSVALSRLQIGHLPLHAPTPWSSFISNYISSRQAFLPIKIMYVENFMLDWMPHWCTN